MTRDHNEDPCCESHPERQEFTQQAPSAEEGYEKALALLFKISTPDGFLASPTNQANYRRVWSRDGVITGLASLMTEDAGLINTFKETLLTLAGHQGPQGEIPSNVDTMRGRVSYGGTVGRVDSVLWFVIGCGEYWRATGDESFLDTMLPVLDKVDFLLRAWEFNNRGLLIVPPAGDWADEYIQSGYVLYDELLYLQAQRCLVAIRESRQDRQADRDRSRTRQLKSLIRANYWFQGVDEPPEGVYHKILYRHGYESPHCRCWYWVPFFSAHGYGYRFDAFANVLASLVDVADDSQRQRVDHFITQRVAGTPQLLPAFHPVIEPDDIDWERLQVSFSYQFRNQPYEYHNGGLWPMLTGFYVADLAQRGQTEQAERFLNGIHWANSLAMDGEGWSFPEFVHGRDFKPGGTRQQGWSAAAAVIGKHALEGIPLFRIREID